MLPTWIHALRAQAPTFEPRNAIGEGCVDSMINTEVAGWSSVFGSATNIYGPPAYKDIVSGKRHSKQVTKRSFQRVFNRAHHTGTTWYRGQYMYIQDFPSNMKYTTNIIHALPTIADRLNQSIQTKQYHGTKHRLVSFTWNCNGLTASAYEELLTQLTLKGVDVATITETHWRLNKTWCSGSWIAHYSSSPEKGDGLLILISATRWKPSAITWNILEPGRLVHARICMCHRHIDTVHVY